jgi:tetratricopeptide (TPR) repeat protein
VSQRPLAWVAGLVTATAILMASPPSQASSLCQQALASRAEAPSETDPLVRTAMHVWHDVYGGVFAATGRQTEVQILGPAARLTNGNPFPPNAFICQTTAVPRLFMTYSLLELIRDQNLYDDAFLALVVGHELGHRVNDFDMAGKITSHGGAKDVESRADARGAYFAAQAGYGTRRLACDDVMDLFLNVEAGVRASARVGRKAALDQTLRNMDVYESLYEAASALLFWDLANAKQVLRWTRLHMESQVQAVAEFYVLEALALIMDAAETAPWQRQITIPNLAQAHLRCTPIYPSHSGLWDQTLADEAAGTKVATRSAALEDARKHLNTALSMGTHEVPAYSALACLELYLGRYDEADTALKRASAALSAAPPAPVKSAIASNAALIAWGRHLAANPVPTDAAGQKAWAKTLRTKGKTFKPSDQLNGLLVRLKRFPVVAAAKPAVASPEFCPNGAPSIDATSGRATMVPLPAVPRSGGCPCGWSELHRLTDPVANDATAGVLTCVPAGWAAGLRYVDIKLPRTPRVRVRMVMDDAPRGALESLETWQRGCEMLVRRGVSEQGEWVYAGLCPDLAAPNAVVSADASCRVKRAVSLGGGQ